jgi:hypothetical protein
VEVQIQLLVHLLLMLQVAVVVLTQLTLMEVLVLETQATAVVEPMVQLKIEMVAVVVQDMLWW